MSPCSSAYCFIPAGTCSHEPKRARSGCMLYLLCSSYSSIVGIFLQRARHRRPSRGTGFPFPPLWPDAIFSRLHAFQGAFLYVPKWFLICCRGTASVSHQLHAAGHMPQLLRALQNACYHLLFRHRLLQWAHLRAAFAREWAEIKKPPSGWLLMSEFCGSLIFRISATHRGPRKARFWLFWAVGSRAMSAIPVKLTGPGHTYGQHCWL